MRRASQAGAGPLVMQGKREWRTGPGRRLEVQVSALYKRSSMSAVYGI